MRRQTRLNFKQPAKDWLIANELDIVPNVLDAIAVNLTVSHRICRMKAIKLKEFFERGRVARGVDQKVQSWSVLHASTSLHLSTFLRALSIRFDQIFNIPSNS
jgi:hypothetical protein